MSAVSVQDACAAVKAAILRLDTAVKCAQKLGYFKAKHQVDALLEPLKVGNERIVPQGLLQVDTWLIFSAPAGARSSPGPCWQQPPALPNHDHGML
jgi:hypothetical protein